MRGASTRRVRIFWRANAQRLAESATAADSARVYFALNITNCTRLSSHAESACGSLGARYIKSPATIWCTACPTVKLSAPDISVTTTALGDVCSDISCPAATEKTLTCIFFVSNGTFDTIPSRVIGKFLTIPKNARDVCSSCIGMLSPSFVWRAVARCVCWRFACAVHVLAFYLRGARTSTSLCTRVRRHAARMVMLLLCARNHSNSAHVVGVALKRCAHF